jgi:hypothetical protein
MIVPDLRPTVSWRARRQTLLFVLLTALCLFGRAVVALPVNQQAMLSAALVACAVPVALDDPAFTDADLDRLLRTEQRFVLYVWSPHMPLSVEGVHEAIRAGHALGIPVVPLLDPRADRTYARSAAAAASLPSHALRVARSAELIRREVFHHAPTVIAFAHGRQAGPVRPGYFDGAGYEHLLRRLFEGNQNK